MSDGEQRRFFREVEHEYWAAGDGLQDDERAVLLAALDPAGRTLEAGTGGGRVLRGLHEIGFSDLTGFDFSPELVASARRLDESGRIAFDEADATSLPYDDGAFDQAIYVQQILCTIESAPGRAAAISEAGRVLRPGSPAVFSFLCLEGRRRSLPERAFLGYLHGLRRIRRSDTPPQLLPRLRLRGRPNPGALRDAGPYNYWYAAGEAEQALRDAGFEPRSFASAEDVVAGRAYASAAELLAAGPPGTILYVSAVRDA